MTVVYTNKLGLRVPDIGTLNWGDEVNDNTEITSSILSNMMLGNIVKFGLLASDVGVLQLDYSAGSAFVGGQEFIITASNKTATAKTGLETVQRNFLYVDDAGAVQISTTAPSGQYALLAIADCDITEITAVYDCRTLQIEKSSMKNKIINGCFSVWQRATSQTSTDYGSDDRWFNSSSGSSKIHSQETFDTGQTDVPGNPKYYSRTVVTSVPGASNEVKKQQRIEGVKSLSGKTVSFSFYARADASKNISTELVQGFGTGGSPSSNVNSIGVNTIALTTSWQKFNVQINIPSISGKTLGTDGNDWLQVGFWFDAGSDFDARTNTLGQQSGTFDIANLQVEEGELATEFEQRSIGQELLLCQRYYEESLIVKSVYSGNVTSGSTYNKNINFITPKRAAATITYSSETVSAFPSGDPSTEENDINGIRISKVANSTSSDGLYMYNWTAESEL